MKKKGLSSLSLFLSLSFSFFTGVDKAKAVSFQSKKVVRETREYQSGRVVVNLHEINEIPEASEPCEPENLEWWNRLRKTGSDLQNKYDEKLKTRFYLLLYEGQQKSYRIPLKDSPTQKLFGGRPIINLDRKHKSSGTVVLSVEYRADGTVADVQLIKGLSSEIDEALIRATRNVVFLPAIKNGAFVTEQGKVEYKYTVY